MNREGGGCARAHQAMETKTSPTGKPVAEPSGYVMCLLLLNRRTRALFSAELIRQGHLTEPSMRCPFARGAAWDACPFRA
jgi:hypothetical protein